jgi:hydrogenase expression/formation protein HypC
MCLAVPGKLVEIYEENGLRMGRIDYSGTRHAACLEYVPDAVEGAYVLVHAGFALSVLDEEEARKSLDLLQEMAEAAAREGTDIFGMPLEGGGRPTKGGSGS